MFDGILSGIEGLDATRTPAQYLGLHPSPSPLPCLVCGERAAAWIQMPSGQWQGKGAARAWVDDGAGGWRCGRTCDRCQERAEVLEREGREGILRSYRETRVKGLQAEAGVPEYLIGAPKALALEWQGLARPCHWREGLPFGGVAFGERAAEVGAQVVRHYLDLRWDCRFVPLVQVVGRAAEEVRGWLALDLLVLSGEGGGLAAWERGVVLEAVWARLDARLPVVWATAGAGSWRALWGEAAWARFVAAGAGRLIRGEGGRI